MQTPCLLHSSKESTSTAQQSSLYGRPGRLLTPQTSDRRCKRHGGRSFHRNVVQMAGNTFGTAFCVTTWGESHGQGVGCVIDGVPPRLPISLEEIQLDLDRRRPGQSKITTPRKESDTCQIMSGLSPDGVTLGTPIMVLVPNKDQKSGDYKEISVAYRPSHADATYDFKYGIRAIAGGGRSSARETIGRVAAGAVAKKLLKHLFGAEVIPSCVSHIPLGSPSLAGQHRQASVGMHLHFLFSCASFTLHKILFNSLAVLTPALHASGTGNCT